MKNQAIYNVRQHYFENKQYLNYNKNYDLLKTSENYRILNSNMAQQILKEVDKNFKSFFSLLKLAQKGEYDYKACKLPHYLPKDGFTLLIGKTIKEIRIIPKSDARFFEIQYIYKAECTSRNLNKNNALAY